MERDSFPARPSNDICPSSPVVLRSKRSRRHEERSPASLPSPNIAVKPLSVKQYFRALKPKTPRHYEALAVKAEIERPIKLSRYQTDFTEVKLIGRGNFGEVYECIHNLDQAKYAVKQIRAHKLRSQSMTRGLAEARSLASIEDTRYVVRYHSAWLEKDCLYIAMELCLTSLTAYVAAHGVTDDLLQRVIHDVGKGLRMMHARGRVHLDLKPDNILLGQTGKFKIADFGLSRVISEVSSDISEGDARYLAPELLDGVTVFPKDIDLTKTDIFSLGATLLELLRQHKLPNNGPEWHLIRSGDVHIPPCSIEFAGLIASMLARSPCERPTAEELVGKGGARKKLKLE
mmetsp:Transcript_7555/g.14063  ORF Transcript_7555/g.14063 Transcript_7555/m.14063 type:complete len:345 (-) Transcript_7555:5816-6850(-)